MNFYGKIFKMRKIFLPFLFSFFIRNLLSQDLKDHGVAVPFSTSRGIIVTKGEDNRNVVCIFLHDSRGCYAILYIDVDLEKSQTYKIPFPNSSDSPYASILSSSNKLYTHFGSHFLEFDPVKKEYTFYKKTYPQMAMSMAEDDNGNIWSATYPNCGLVSFNPETKELIDYGSIHKENWAQYPRYIAVDETGWVYIGVGYTKSNIIGFNPKTREKKYMIEESERSQGGSSLFRAENGKVYGQGIAGKKDNWYEFYNGESKKIGILPSEIKRKTYISGSQGLFHKDFPDGKKIKKLDLEEKILIIEDPKTKEIKEVKFDYESEGGHIMGIVASPDGSICGGTAFPFYFFKYDPKTDKWTRYPCYGQWNTLAVGDKKVFVGGYTGGFFLEYDPFLPWTGTIRTDENSNPKFITESSPDINRPHDLLPYSDGKILILAGTPGYGYTGGGLLFWDRESKTKTLLKHTDLIPFHSVMSMVALSDGKILCGTTTSAGTGGEKKAKIAELFILDINTKKIIWNEKVFENVESYTDLFYDKEKKLVYGFADRYLFFVFDPETKKIVHKYDTKSEFGLCVSNQGPNSFILTDDNRIFILFTNNIAILDRENFKISPVKKLPFYISNGGAYIDGRIYFVGSSRLYSFPVK